MTEKNKAKKKILFVITKSNFGGAQKYVFELALEMTKLGHEVVVVLGGEGLLKQRLDDESIRVISINSLKRDINVFSEIKTFFELISVFKKENPDVVHLNSSKIGGLGGLAGRLCGIKKIIFTIHGWAFNENRSWFSKLIIKKLYWLTILLSHKSIAVSEAVKRQVKDIPCSFLIKNKVCVIKNEILPINFIPKDEARKFFAEKINLPNINEYKIIGGAHELHHIKGINYLIDAASEIIKNNTKIIFIIAGTGEEKERLEKQIKDLGLENNFFLIGYLENASRYLKAFDIFVITSLSEALPLSVLEAKQAGIKIISTNVGGIPEALKNYNSKELIPSKDYIAIKNAINKALNNDYSDVSYSEENNFSQMLEETLAIYED